MFKNLLVFLLGIALVSCSWVDITDEGKAVSVREKDQVADCKKVGRVTASLADKVAGVKRSKEKVEKELEILARNNAVDYGGNTIVATTEVKEGKQSYDVYKCP
ncbi:MAG: DUF4156 domain-containing protein [Gammaproteobacteria bacterium]|jgi:hypothetical protein